MQIVFDIRQVNDMIMLIISLKIERHDINNIRFLSNTGIRFVVFFSSMQTLEPGQNSGCLQMTLRSQVVQVSRCISV